MNIIIPSDGTALLAPLKYTVDVAPMSTTVIEFEANELGDWFFHCHLLYHMEAGMARVVHYEEYSLTPELAAIRPRLSMDPWYFWGQASLFSNMAEAALTLANTRNIFPWSGKQDGKRSKTRNQKESSPMIVI